MEDLSEAWYKLEIAHLEFEATEAGTPQFRARYDELLLALEEYRQVLERMKPREPKQ